ncbi:MAG: hypothetical protein ABW168_21880 [Sedimenticola sp.]
MKANPGGQIDLKEVVGRDEIINQIWDTLEQQSIRMNAERRIGKTTIIKKICLEPRSGWAPIFQDLEQYHTALEFAMAIYREVEKFLSSQKKTTRHARKLFEAMGGIEVAGVFKLPASSNTAPWKDILSSAIQDLVEVREKRNERPVFLWDEVPLMLDNIKKREGEPAAMEVLDTLRGLRQTHGGSGLRMIITGSIGLHHVINSLRQQGYTNSSVNDMLAIKVLPLDMDSACELANKLLQGEGVPASNRGEVTTAIARISDAFPFYIHHIVKALKQTGIEGSTESVEQIVADQLVDAGDPWELNHYRDRIEEYYGKASEKIVLAILDGIAVRSKAISLDFLLAELKATGILDDRERLIDLLRLIEQDHYLSRNSDGHYRFQFPLLQRWWKLARGL